MKGYFVGAVVLDCADQNELAGFYAELLDGEIIQRNQHYVQLRLPSGLRLTFQEAQGYLPPVWPEEPGRQQQMAHLDIMVDDLETAVAHAERLGAKKANAQYVPGMVTMKDPAGHPFCLIPLPGE